MGTQSDCVRSKIGAKGLWVKGCGRKRGILGEGEWEIHPESGRDMPWCDRDWENEGIMWQRER